MTAIATTPARLRFNLEDKNSATISFWIVITEDYPADCIAGVFPQPLSETDAKAIAARYREGGYASAEAVRVVADARNMIDTARLCGVESY